MSSRVSRLAQIRQRRNKTTEDGGAAASATAGVDSLQESTSNDTGVIIAETQDVADETEPVVDQSVADPEPRDPNAIDLAEQDEHFRDIYEQTGVFEATKTDSEQAISYNSDLKDDLAPLYGRARHGTDRAINAIIQRKVREDLV